MYRNEQHIGEALKTLLSKYNLKREDIFITTKLSELREVALVLCGEKTWRNDVTQHSRDRELILIRVSSTSIYLHAMIKESGNLPPVTSFVLVFAPAKFRADSILARTVSDFAFTWKLFLSPQFHH